MGRRIETIPAAVLYALVRYSWPDNGREIQTIIERAVILSPSRSLRVPRGDPEPGASGWQMGRLSIHNVLREILDRSRLKAMDLIEKAKAEQPAEKPKGRGKKAKGVLGADSKVEAVEQAGID